MSFKQELKMKLPFTRKGLEDHLDEKLTLMRHQQGDEMEARFLDLQQAMEFQVKAQTELLFIQLRDEMSLEFHRQIDDLQQAVESQSGAQAEHLFEQLKEETNLQLHRRINDLQQAVESQSGAQAEHLFEQLREEMNLQLHRRINDLQQAVENQTAAQTEKLFAQIREEMNHQFHCRTNDLQQAVESQIKIQAELLFGRLKEEMNQQLHKRTNDLDHAISSVKNELYGFFRFLPKTMLNFEVALAEHCNLNCVGCNHFSPLVSSSFANLEEFTRDFKRMAHLFGERTQRIKLLGGEPLLNRDINKYLLVARQCFPVAEIMIITNGLLLPKMDESFWKICRENQITLAPTKYPVSFDYDAVEELAKAHQVRYFYFAEKEDAGMFEKYAIDPQGLQDCEGNYRMCFMANSCVHLLHGHLYTCPIAPTAHYLNEAFGTQLRESPHDSIDIYQAKSAEEILEFLAKPIPFCRYCRRDIIINDIPWSQSKRELSEWTI